MAAILSKNHLKSGQKCPDFEWLGVGTIAMGVCIPNMFGISMVELCSDFEWSFIKMVGQNDHFHLNTKVHMWNTVNNLNNY